MTGRTRDRGRRCPSCGHALPHPHNTEGPTMAKTCECGCGQPTALAKQTDTARGYVKGQPVRFIHGHHLRLLATPKQDCTVADCNEPRYGRGWCTKHHARWVRTGSPTALLGHRIARIPIRERLAQQVEKNDNGCWLWTGVIKSNGYGTIGHNGRTWHTHRLMYELDRGPIPAGLVIDHLCRIPDCCNPAHLEPVTDAENVRRGNSPPTLFNRDGRCQRGHNLAVVGIYVSPKGRRNCRGCIALRRAGEHKARAG